MTLHRRSGQADRARELGNYIREQRRLAELSVRKLSERAGISNPYLSQIERGLRNPSATILGQIAMALEISAETLLMQAGILDPEAGGTGASDVTDAIRADPDLTERDKQTLLHVYGSLRRPAVAPDSGTA